MAKKSTVKGGDVVLNCMNKHRGGQFPITANAFSRIKFDSSYIVKGAKYYEDKAVAAGAIRSE